MNFYSESSKSYIKNIFNQKILEDMMHDVFFCMIKDIGE